jgi:hypothetical protein
MFGFPNLDDEVNVYDKRQSNGFFSVIGTEPIICKYRKGDVLKVLLYEKPLLEGYNRIDVLYVSVENYVIIDTLDSKTNAKLWRIHISFSNGTITGGGAEIIENLDQKIRDIKLNKLLYEER